MLKLGKKLLLFLLVFVAHYLFGFNVFAQGTQPQQSNVILTIPNPLGSDVQVLDTLLANVITWIFNISFPILIAVIIWSGIKFITSRGNSTELSKAKNILWWAIVGFVIILIGRGFVTLINSILSLG